jgi:hypothetical protein
METIGKVYTGLDEVIVLINAKGMGTTVSYSPSFVRMATKDKLMRIKVALNRSNIGIFSKCDYVQMYEGVRRVIVFAYISFISYFQLYSS